MSFILIVQINEATHIKKNKKKKNYSKKKLFISLAEH